MRRTNRQLTDPARIEAILAGCDCCRLGLCAGGQPYVVPLSFGYEWEEGRLTLYFHCAREGRKLDYIAQNPRAAFEMDTSRRYLTAGTPCGWSMEYESLMGEGTITLAAAPEQKRRGLSLLMAHAGYEGEMAFPDAALAAVEVLVLRVECYSAKANRQ